MYLQPYWFKVSHSCGYWLPQWHYMTSRDDWSHGCYIPVHVQWKRLPISIQSMFGSVQLLFYQKQLRWFKMRSSQNRNSILQTSILNLFLLLLMLCIINVLKTLVLYVSFVCFFSSPRDWSLKCCSKGSCIFMTVKKFNDSTLYIIRQHNRNKRNRILKICIDIWLKLIWILSIFTFQSLGNHWLCIAQYY